MAATANPAQVQTACERIAAHLDPDGAPPDPKAAFDRRGLTLSRSGSMVALRGQLDPEAGAALMTALDSCTPPFGRDDLRTAAQRRADALADLVRRTLDQGELPMVQRARPHLGILITPDTLLTPTRPGEAGVAVGDHRADRAGPPTGPAHPSRPRDRLAEAGVPPVPDPAQLDWFGDVPTAIAQRVACDCDVWRAVLEPATGLPLDVGRVHRLVPHWIRKALHARDQGCRFPGCLAPVVWTDAHHLRAWYEGGETAIENLACLCRYHHVMVHEGQWTMALDSTTGEVDVYRPDGRGYELNPSRSPTAGPRAAR